VQHASPNAIGWLANDSGSERGREKPVAVSIIRFKTFEALEIPYTCCVFRDAESSHTDEYQSRFTTRDEEEVKEIFDEHRHNICLLEELMSEFEAIYMGTDGTLVEFLDGFWNT
jgi:hypothetical protein